MPLYFLTYEQIENQVIQPAVIGMAVSLSSLTMVIALVGAGLPGAMIAVPIVGVAKTVVRLPAADRAPWVDGGW